MKKRLFGFNILTLFSVCKKRDVSELEPQVSGSQAKKPRLVFTDLQRRTLQAIFKVCIKAGYLDFSWMEQLFSTVIQLNEASNLPVYSGTDLSLPCGNSVYFTLSRLLSRTGQLCLVYF